MKKRALVAALCCLSTASTTAVAAPVATAQAATANKTMADQYQPTFPELHTPFGTNDDETVEKVYFSGVPEGTTLERINSDRLSDMMEGGNKLLIDVFSSFFWLQIFPENRSYDKNFEKTIDLAVNYPDGSTEVVTHTFTINPAERHQYLPEIKNDLIEVGQNTRLEVSEIPSSATVSLLRSPEDWNVKQEGNAFTVTPPVEGNGEFVYKVTFSDGTSKIVTSDVWAEKAPKNIDNPVRPGNDDFNPSSPVNDDKPSAPATSGGSSTAGIIAGVIGAVLAIALSIGGAAFAGLIPGLKLPF